MSESKHAIFLSYASQDSEAAKRICEALRAAGVEVWFDQNELVGGDAWDAKIRGQIASCALFVPIISVNTQARLEGYFRLEWKLAAQRTHTMADEKAFLLPIVIDETRDIAALVPSEFKAVQWTRLTGGEGSEKFTERVKRLLDQGNAGNLLSAAGPASPARAITTARRSERPWLAAVLGGIGVAVLALLWARPWQRPEPSRSPSAATQGGEVTSTEVRPLVAKAWEQMNKPEMARAELEIADALCKRATDLDPNDSDAWAAWSQVDAWMLYHNFDDSSSRHESTRTKASRALHLNPKSFEARLAQACQLVRAGTERGQTSSAFDQEANSLLRELLREKPDEPRALLTWGILLRNTGKIDEARDAFSRMARIPAFAAQAWNELGWAEYFNGNVRAADAATDRSLALQPYWGNLTLKYLIASRWWGDLDAAKAALDQIPLAVRQEDNSVALEAELYFLRREPEAVLRALNSVSRDWLRSNGYDGPKAFLAARAHDMAGRQEAARVQREIALSLVERRLTQQSDSQALRSWKGSVLASLGRLAEAESALKLAREMAAQAGVASFDPDDHILLGQFDEAISALEHRTKYYPGMTPAFFRLDPRWDALRQHPRFQALLARLEADPRFSPKASVKP